MKKLICTLGFLLMICCSLNAQTVTGEINDFIVKDKLIWALTDSGNIKFFNISNGSIIKKKLPENSGILAFAADKNGNIVIAGADKKLKRYNERKNTWEQLARYTGKPFGIVFDNKNLCYLITSNGIRDIQTTKVYSWKKRLFLQLYSSEPLMHPDCYFMDKDNRIWFGYDFGEWGGQRRIFDTKEKAFLIPDPSNINGISGPVKSFFEDDSTVYLSSGLSHMGVTSGTIERFDDLKPVILFGSDKLFIDSNGKMAEYIGPATFNKFNNSIYFYSQNGFFKGSKAKDLSKLGNWEIILKPDLSWEKGQRYAFGSAMNVLKLSVIDKDKFIFLSSSDGIGYYDGVKLIMIK